MGTSSAGNKGRVVGKPRRQCKHCPWKVTTDPHDIPEYSEEQHRALTCTRGGDGIASLLSPALQIMVCHETPVGGELPCVGWLAHEIGPGNNIIIRLRALLGQIDLNVLTIGEQHACLEETFPKASEAEVEVERRNSIGGRVDSQEGARRCAVRSVGKGKAARR